MRKAICIFLFLSCLFPSLFSQEENSVWISFQNKGSDLIGYKDLNGNIRIEPKFGLFTSVGKFENIIAVSEKQEDNHFKNYYLTKDGKIVGKDSLYISDFSYDCENEGFIRFQHKGLIGILNSKGEVVVPAIYNYLTNMRNGMAIGLKDAIKKHEDNNSGCEHFEWSGGKYQLIDTLNQVLAENVNYNGNLNFYSVKQSAYPVSDSISVCFPSKDGRYYYSFVDFSKEFKKWFSEEFSKNTTPEKLLQMSFDSIIWEGKNKWETANKLKFITNNFHLLKKVLEKTVSNKTEQFLSFNMPNPFIGEKKQFKKYLNNYGELMEWKYPALTLYVSSGTTGQFQDQFDFIRTNEGYRLFSVTFRSHTLK